MTNFFPVPTSRVSPSVLNWLSSPLPTSSSTPPQSPQYDYSPISSRLIHCPVGFSSFVRLSVRYCLFVWGWLHGSASTSATRLNGRGVRIGRGGSGSSTLARRIAIRSKWPACGFSNWISIAGWGRGWGDNSGCPSLLLKIITVWLAKRNIQLIKFEFAGEMGIHKLLAFRRWQIGHVQ